MRRSLFFDIPRYVTKGYISILFVQCEEIRTIDIQNHVNFMYIWHFRCRVDLVYFVLFRWLDLSKQQI